MTVRRNAGSGRSVDDTNKLPGRTSGSIQAIRSSGSSACATRTSSHRQLRAEERDTSVFRSDPPHRQVVPNAARKSRSRRRSEEHTSELQSLKRISYAVFCLKKKTNHKKE